MYLEAPDAFFAAACLTECSLYNGKGDRTELIKYILTQDPKTIKDLGRKIYLITQEKVGTYNIYDDKKMNAATPVHTFNKAWVFKLWLHCCR